MGRESRSLEAGDLFIRLMSGGSGLGDPVERDPQAVAEDVATGMVTQWAADRVFGVVVEDGELDRAATERRREQLRAERLEEAVPYEAFAADWRDRQPPEDILEYYGAWPAGMVEREPVAADR